MKEIQGGICAAKGFKANGIHCGIRKNKTKRDLSLVVSDVRAAAAAVYTTNLVKGAPILVNQKHLADGYAQAIICNSGIANTCNANGVEMAEEMGKLVEKATGVKSDDVVIASTGVIGMPLNVTPIANGMDELVAGLGYDNNSLAAEGIMTTDTKKKETAVSFEIDGVECRIGGMAKGSGMIHPNMATMLVFVTSDVAITSEMLQKAVSDDVKTSFNMISVDGDTSTNDTFAVLANGMAGNKLIDSEGEAYDAFCEALHKVSVDLSRKIAGDGEGATKLLECKVTGGKTDEIAKKVAKSVICSSLTKAAMFGADANWGRVLCAIGYSGADVDIEKINVSFKSAKGTIEVCRNGAGVDFSEEKAKEILLENEIDILVDLNDGDFDATAWGCDLTYEYVKINGDYRT
ncbi:MAG: bifunctional glutamate N-acetyltransferase/amino-acid acetyltransferase ArgJ [Clostridiaceae bacterium]|nr:bifunctional glutamate N-acetyltransferase/amino-acid acetyltransferase ArgJ [Clostridiaceae bacterium]